jgi:hypothetical protein
MLDLLHLRIALRIIRNSRSQAFSKIFDLILIQSHSPLETGFKGIVICMDIRAQSTAVFFQEQGAEGAHTNDEDTMYLPALLEHSPQLQSVFSGCVGLPAQFAALGSNKEKVKSTLLDLPDLQGYVFLDSTKPEMGE